MIKRTLKLDQIIRWTKRYSGQLVYASRPIPPLASPTTRLRIIGFRLCGYALAASTAYLILQADMPWPDKGILVVGLLVLVSRLASSVFFGLALVLLVYVPILQATGHVEASDNFAVYAFYCLCFGTVSALLHLTRDADADEREA